MNNIYFLIYNVATCFVCCKLATADISLGRIFFTLFHISNVILGSLLLVCVHTSTQ